MRFVACLLMFVLMFSVFSFTFSFGGLALSQRLIGDIDADSAVTVSDALKVLRIATKIDSCDKSELEILDVSGDGSVGIDDAIGLLRCSVGLIGSYGYTGVKLDYTLRDASKNVKLTQEYIENAVLNEGNPARLARVMEKAASGQTINIATLGGSITEGYYANNSNTCYAGRVAAWWRENFPNARVNFYNMGIAGTTSVLGVHRLEKDILNKNIDFLIVEFAVNDYEDMTPYYENIIRRALSQDNDMAVMMAVSTTESKWTRQKEQLPVGQAYQVPMISDHNIVWDLIDDGVYTWDELTSDDAHPNELGHTIYGEIICTYLDAVKAKYNRLSKVVPVIPEAIFGEDYMEAKLLTSKDIEADSLGAWKVSSAINLRHISGGWRLEKRGKVLQFTLKFKELNILFPKMASDPNYGSVKVYVDGEEAKILDANFAGGWGDYYAVENVYKSDEIKERTVTFSYNGGKFDLLGLLVS